MPNDRQQRFLDAVKSLNLKFPVAEIAAKTGSGESTVSTYLNKREVSRNFLLKFCEVFKLDFDEIWNGPQVETVAGDDGGIIYEKAAPELTQSMLSKLADGNKILAHAQQDAITTAKDAVATANKIADGNLVLIEANNKMASLIIDMQRKTVTESILQENLSGVDAKLKVLLELSILDGIGTHWSSYDEGQAKLNKRIDEAIQNTQASDNRNGAGK